MAAVVQCAIAEMRSVSSEFELAAEVCFATGSNSDDTGRISAIAHRATAAMKLASAILHALVLWTAAVAGMASAELPLIAAHHFTSCLDVYLNGGDRGATAPTGSTRSIPNGGAAVDVYYDMSDSGGWTKFLQYNDMYTPNIGAVGTISGPGGVSGNPAANAKLSDADINAIGGKAFYVRFVMGTTTSLYGKFDGLPYDDTARAFMMEQQEIHGLQESAAFPSTWKMPPLPSARASPRTRPSRSR